MIEKEVWIYLLAYNLIRMSTAQATLAVAPGNLNHHDYLDVLLLPMVENTFGPRLGRMKPRSAAQQAIGKQGYSGNPE